MTVRTIRRSLAVGIFDGVHIGHRRILREAVSQAKKLGARPGVVTFHPHPDKVLHPGKKRTPDLMSIEHRIRTIRKEGIDEVIVIPFTKALSRMSPERFLTKILLGRLGGVCLCVGDDFRFGHKGAGDVAFLKAASVRLGFRLRSIPAVTMGGKAVSSTRIRHHIEEGELLRASRLLGRPVSIYGTVIRGRGRGRSIGFPTANLDPHHEALPPEGVYAAWGEWAGGRHQGVVHIGIRPTFGDRQKSVEVHFPGFSGDLYGKDLELFFIRRLRGTRSFASAEDLTREIRRDIARAKRLLT